MSSAVRTDGAALLLVWLTTVALGGCADDRVSDSAPPGPGAGVAPAPSAAPMAGAAPATADAWLGRWQGPEGTSLTIAGGDGRYQVTIQDLDGPRTFAGTARDGGIELVRDGVTERIRATDGAGTGMKWLAEKKICLATRAGEGWCRD